MTSSYLIASLLIGLSLLNWWLTPVHPGWIRLLAGAGLFAVLTAAVLDLAGSPLAPHLATVSTTRLWQQVVLSGWWLLAARLLVELVQATPRTKSFSREGRLFSDLLAALVYLAVLLTIVSVVFGLPVGGLVATSGVIAIVLGLALQNTLADVFAGIAVGIERPYAIGDLVCLDGPVEGEVVQINWRSVQIRTGGNDIATIPNSLVAKSRIINRSVPSPRRTDSVSVPCDAAVAPDAVIELIHRAVLLCPQILPMPAPFVALTRLGRRSHHYHVAFSVAHSDLLGSAKSDLLRQVLRQFRAAEFGPGDATVAAETSGGGVAPHRRDLLAIPLFDDLPQDTRLHLAEHLIRHLLEPGQVLFAQGDAEASLFIVAAGVLEVSRTVMDAHAIVGRIGAGDYIGEIGMLTGAPHAATVTALTACTVFELCHAEVAPLLAEKPELLRAFEASARRGQALIDRSVAASVGAATAPDGALLDRIRRFFHLPAG